MLNHPVTSVQNGARWRQESLLADAASYQATDETSQWVRWGLIISAVVLAFFGGRGA
ncbi:MAG: hypothetical protein M3Z20_18210 [Chloroflexota bacterium]|nr:hypothetical protein [Chloroflexota bacterium]